MTQRTNAVMTRWATALANDQVKRVARTGTERIDHVLPPDCCDEGLQAVDRILGRMEACGRWKECRVLRTEFLLAGLSEADRLAFLSRLGLRISRASYYAYLSSARAYLDGALGEAIAA